jgi:hypothetical protein
MAKYEVHLVATIPASANLLVEAENEEAASDYAEEHYAEADWDGSDYTTPQGCDVEVFEITQM